MTTRSGPERRAPVVPTARPAVLSVVAAPLDEPVTPELTGALGERLRRMIRWNDIVVPQGLDRFGLLCQHVPDDVAMLVIADRLEAGLREPVVVGGRTVELSASVGLAAGPANQQRPVEQLASAEAARSLAVSWIAAAVQEAIPQTARTVALLRPDSLDSAEVRAFGELVADRLVADAALMPAGQGLLMLLPELRVSDVLALSEEVSQAWRGRTPVDAAAARLDAAGRPRFVTSALPPTSGGLSTDHDIDRSVDTPQM